jgi:hypothetical protein
LQKLLEPAINARDEIRVDQHRDLIFGKCSAPPKINGTATHDEDVLKPEGEQFRQR